MRLAETGTTRLELALHDRQHLNQSVGVIAYAPQNEDGSFVGLAFLTTRVAVDHQSVHHIPYRPFEGLRQLRQVPTGVLLGAFRGQDGQRPR